LKRKVGQKAIRAFDLKPIDVFFKAYIKKWQYVNHTVIASKMYACNLND
jgi:hypothetical protein